MNPTKATDKPQAIAADKFPTFRGEFSLVIRDKSGKIIETYVDKNLIVNGSKTAVARLLDGSNPNKRVTKIAFGTSNIAPDISDTVITNAVIKTLSGSTYPEFNSIQFAWILDYAEGNGLSISEFGLLCEDTTLFARKTRTAIAKTADLQLTGVWKIVF